MSPLTGALCSALLCRIEKVIDFLEGHIDPFDLDVFTPHLNSNLNRLVQRTSVGSRAGGEQGCQCLTGQLGCLQTPQISTGTSLHRGRVFSASWR